MTSAANSVFFSLRWIFGRFLHSTPFHRHRHHHQLLSISLSFSFFLAVFSFRCHVLSLALMYQRSFMTVRVCARAVFSDSAISDFNSNTTLLHCSHFFVRSTRTRTRTSLSNVIKLKKVFILYYWATTIRHMNPLNFLLLHSFYY